MNADPSNECNRQLIVLLPESLAGNIELSSRIQLMALRDHFTVLYLTLVDSIDRKLTAERAMTTMKALTSGNSLRVESIVIEAAYWQKTLKSVYQEGDIVVCQAEQLVRKGLFETVPADRFVKESLLFPVITVFGFYHPQNEQLKKWFKGLIYWGGCLLLLVLFFFFSVEIDQGSNGLLRTFFGIFAMALEISAVWAWTVFARR